MQNPGLSPAERNPLKSGLALKTQPYKQNVRTEHTTGGGRPSRANPSPLFGGGSVTGVLLKNPSVTTGPYGDLGDDVPAVGLVFSSRDSSVEMSKRKSLANSVPAAAVRQRGRVLSIWTRHKTQVGCLFGSYSIRYIFITSFWKQIFLNISMGKRMAQEAVECQHKGWNF